MAYISTGVLSGQRTSIDTTPVRVSDTNLPAQEVLVQSDPANTTNILVGGSSGQFIVLTPGQSITLPVNTLTMVWVKMVSGTGTVNWMIRN